MKQVNILCNLSGRIFRCNDVDDVVLDDFGRPCYQVHYYGRDSIFLKPVATSEVVEIQS